MRSDIDLAAAVSDEVNQLGGAHPDRRIELSVTGDTQGRWDGARLQQLLRNLVTNAMDYGFPDTPVRVALRGEDGDDVCLEVTNSGPPMDPSALTATLGTVEKKCVPRDSRHGYSHLGLGLFIVREIADAHGGVVEVRSDGETTVALRLPRRSPDENIRSR